MDRLDIEDVIKVVCETIPKANRFSELSHLELCDLWKGLSRYLTDQLLLKKSTNIPGIGSFFIRKSADCPENSVHFFPSRSWDRIPGFQIDRCDKQESGMAEMMNMSLLAQITGFQRDMVEAGLKDIVHAVFRILKRGSVAILIFGSLGRLILQSPSIKFRFSSNFFKIFNDGKPEGCPVFCSPSPQPQSVANSCSIAHQKAVAGGKQTEKWAKTVGQTSGVSSYDGLQITAQPICQSNASAVSSGSSANAPDLESADINSHKLEPLEVEDSFVDSSRPPVIDGDSRTSNRILTTMEELDEATRKLSKLEELIDKTFSAEARNVATHTHHHSGNRLWTDQKCPICRANRAPYVDSRDIEKRIEQEHDRNLLHLSLDLDKDFINTKKENESAKLRNNISTAHYNYLKALEKQKLLSKKEPLSMRSLFETRAVNRDPALTQQALAFDLKQQIEFKNARALEHLEQKKAEYRLENELSDKELKAAALQAHWNKTQRYKAQKNALYEQIQLNQQSMGAPKEAPLDNPFSRSESLMALYQKEKVKQLYQEQLAIVRQRRDYARRISEIEKHHSLSRLTLSRKELENDLRLIKHGKTNARKGLESFWADQILWKQRQNADIEQSI
ncbi:hypothetical protein BASA50_009519 [Batrachochytrium salamandrivorans]|uniref:CCDC81 HU domain-containing protein n=1 Tax=Batrachochytrium salamandrivorans TaxID=1357716 RepID=A0ABQ8F1N8_9FUNG|nr:hypothetical protein BASA50_009519 [Batrachochytrium salamandrivorans]